MKKLLSLILIALLALPLAVAVFSAQFGLLCNLKWHRFDWTNEATVIKQSLAAALPIQREEIPATKKRPGVPRSGVDDRLDYRWIDLRTDKNQFLFRDV